MKRQKRKQKCHKHSLATNLVSDKRGKEPETVIESYRRLVDLQHMTKDIATLTWKRKRRDCEVIGDLLSVPMGVVEDINGRGMTDLLERVATETREWAGKYSHSTVERNYHEGIKEALVFARGALGLNSEEAFKHSLSRRLLMIRREESPPKEPLECPTDDDVATVLRFADEVIAEQRPRPGLRMSRKTGEWERRMRESQGWTVPDPPLGCGCWGARRPGGRPSLGHYHESGIRSTFSSLEANFSDEVRDYGNANEPANGSFDDVKLNSYMVNDLSLNYNLWGVYDVFFDVVNLFDKKYNTALQYSQMDRSYNFGIKRKY